MSASMLTCLECQELLSAYALGALDEDEAKAVRAHLAQPTHEGCLEALASAERTAARLADQLTPIKPRGDMWAGIEARLQTRSAPPASSGARGSVWRAVAALLAVAVVVLVVISLAGRSKLQNSESELVAVTAHAKETEAKVAAAQVSMHDCTDDLSRLKTQLKLSRDAVALADHQGSKVMPLDAKLPDSPSATAVVNLAERRAFVVLEKINVPSAHDYELWVIRGDQKKPAGLLRPTSDGALAVDVDPKLLADGVDALAVTLEPAGGGPAPRGPIALVGVMPKT